MQVFVVYFFLLLHCIKKLTLFQAGVSMVLPHEVFEKTKEKNVRLEFVSYRTSSLFLPEVIPPEHIMLNQKVITATIHGAEVKNLRTPVEYSIDNIQVQIFLFFNRFTLTDPNNHIRMQLSLV